MKIKRNSKVKFRARTANYAVLASITLLLVCGVGLIYPMVGSQAFASCTDGTNMEGCSVARATVESEVNVGTSISLAVDNQAELDLIPNSRGATGTMGTVVRIATNSQDGYALFVQAQGDGSLKNTTIVAGAEDKNIESTKQAATLDNLDLNTYGYYLGKAEANSNTTYSPMNITGTEAVITTDKPTIVGDNGENYLYGDNYNLAFGVKVGTDLPAGTYTGEVLISAVANPETIRSLAQVTYMQDMRPEICAQTAENYTKQLIDTRDGKSYWVAKLADGNCWMTQNLALDIVHEDDEESEEERLTPKTAYALTVNGQKTKIDSGNTNIPNNYDLLLPATKYVVETNREQTDIGLSWNPVGADNKHDIYVLNHQYIGNNEIFENGYNAITSTLAQRENFFTNVTDTNDVQWSDYYEAADNNTVDDTNHRYDAHFLVGNFYQDSIARAKLLTTNDAEISSICPSGWTLPAQDDNTGRSWQNLLAEYGISNGDTINESSSVVYNKPLYLANVGFMDVPYAVLVYIGHFFGYITNYAPGLEQSWQGTQITNVNGTIQLTLSKNKMRNNNRGFSIRCIAE